jgi:hypothetical protein
MRLFRHRHHYIILRPGCLQDPLTGGLFPCSRLFCRCGQEDPYTVRLREAIKMEIA